MLVPFITTKGARVLIKPEKLVSIYESTTTGLIHVFLDVKALPDKLEEGALSECFQYVGKLEDNPDVKELFEELFS